MKKIFVVALIMVALALFGFYLALTNTPPKELSPVDTNPTATSSGNVSTNQPVNAAAATMVDEKSGILFSYPTELDYKYISTSEWPPRFISSFAPIQCELDEQTKAMSGLTDRTEIINDTLYCIWYRDEGAAGSTYTNYQVSYEKDNQYITMSFTLKYPQCDNYSSEEKVICETEQENFPLHNLIDEIAQSASLPSY